MERIFKALQVWIVPVLAAASSVLFLTALYRYGTFPSYVDHSEPATAFRAWLAVHGHAIYRSPDAADYLTTQYGPLTYLLNGAVLKLLGGTLLTSKLTSLAASVLSVVLLAATIGKRYGTGAALFAILFFTCFLMFGAPHTLWVRPDPVIILLVTVALFSTILQKETGNPWPTAVIIGVSVGLAVNFKANAFLFFIPIVVGYCTAQRLVVWPVMVALSIGVFLLPFALPPVTLGLYLDDLFKTGAVRDIAPALIVPALRYSLVFLSPLAVLGIVWKTNRTAVDNPLLLYTLAFLGCVGVGLYLTVVPGTYWYHMIPFFPVSVDLIFRYGKLMGAKPTGRLAVYSVFALAFMILAVTPQKRFHRFLNDRLDLSRQAAEAVSTVIRENPGAAIEMGYGDNVTASYSLSFVKPLLAFKGNDTMVEGHSDMETSYWGLQANDAKIKRLKACTARIWLIPQGEQPFALANYYQDRLASPAAVRRIYSRKFQDAFLESYEKQKTQPPYDVWTCRQK